MGLEKVKERVLKEARQKAAQEIKAARDEGKRIMYAAKEQAKAREAELRRQFEKEAANIRKREAAASKLDAKKQNLLFRKQFADSLFAEVQDTLDALPDKERADHLHKLLEKASREIDVAVVYCNKRDRALIVGSKTKEADIIGGLIAESKDGTTIVDYSYEAVLEQLKESLLPELNALLFRK